ncbi:HlyD family efflux transporter periplasmic adaptor subunit [Microvirga thermotolerans]|nr:HlyD family efflux transporter periplasmic adaptor subunit [Microvirga thermotolerans]
MTSPDLAYKAAQAERKVRALADQIAATSQNAESLARSRILAHEWEGAKAERDALAVELERLDIRAPVSGTVVELADPMAEGEWVKQGEKLASIADLSQARIEAYVDEAVVPELPLYRVILETSQPLRTTRAQPGTVHLSGRSASILRTVWRRVVTVLVRESGF